MDEEPNEPARETCQVDPLELAMARNRPMVAALPRSRYLNGTDVSALEPRTMVLAACRPPCMATSATPGRSFEGDHVADDEDLGMPGQGEVG